MRIRLRRNLRRIVFGGRQAFPHPAPPAAPEAVFDGDRAPAVEAKIWSFFLGEGSSSEGKGIFLAGFARRLLPPRRRYISPGTSSFRLGAIEWGPLGDMQGCTYAEIHPLS